MLKVTGRGSSPSIKKVLCQPVTGKAEEEATLDPTCMSGRVLVTGSQIVTVAVVGAGGVLGGTSSGLSG